MIEIVQAGGWLMLPIIACSVIAAAIILERFWTLQPKRVAPRGLASEVRKWIGNDQLDAKLLQKLHKSSPLGEMLATGLANRNSPREVLKERVEDVGRHVVHDLEKFLTSLGTIATVTPLLGLLGTVVGMIRVFAAITSNGVGNPGVLAGGISEALITTAAGLSVAIPSLIAYRYLRSRVDGLVVAMEKETIKFLEQMTAHKLSGDASADAASDVHALNNESPEPIKRRA